MGPSDEHKSLEEDLAEPVAFGRDAVLPYPVEQRGLLVERSTSGAQRVQGA